MWSYEHFGIGVFSMVMFYQFMLPVGEFGSVFFYLGIGLTGGLVSVLIDLDHFLISRLKKGDWSDFRNALRNPFQVLRGKVDVFESENVSPGERLLSHVGIIFLMDFLMVLTFLRFGVSWMLMLLGVSFCLKTHVFADLLRDEGLY